MKKLNILFLLMLLMRGASYLPLPDAIYYRVVYATMLLSMMVVIYGIYEALVPTKDTLKEEVDEMFTDFKNKGR